MLIEHEIIYKRILNSSSLVVFFKGRVRKELLFSSLIVIVFYYYFPTKSYYLVCVSKKTFRVYFVLSLSFRHPISFKRILEICLLFTYPYTQCLDFSCCFSAFLLSARTPGFYLRLIRQLFPLEIYPSSVPFQCHAQYLAMHVCKRLKRIRESSLM